MSDFHEVTLADGHRVSYAEYGDPAGAPLLFFHGWPSSRLQGRLCHEAARNLGWRVIAPDRPGIGSTPFANGRTLADWPPLLDRFLDALDVRAPVALLGVSGGAPYVYATAHAMPDRVGPAGVLCGAVPLAEVHGQSEMMLPYRVLLWARRRAPAVVRASMALGSRASSWPRRHPGMWMLHRFIPPCDRAAMEADLLYDCVMGSFREAVKNGVQPVIADADIYTTPWPFQLEDIQTHIHLWHGTLDHNIPLNLARQVIARLPHCHPHICEGEGHYSLPAHMINEALEMLKETPTSQDP